MCPSSIPPTPPHTLHTPLPPHKQALQPSCVALELCRGRLQAMLLDPYADPMWDVEPCPIRAAEQAAAKNRTLGEIFEATLKSRDHNVLMTALSGMYARLEGEGCVWG